MCSTFFHVFVSHHNFRSRSQWALVSSWTSSSSSRSSKSSRIWSSKELNSDAKRPWHDKVQFQSSDVSRLWRNRFQAVKIPRISLASSCIQFIREDPAFRPCITLAKSYGISDMKDVACCTALCLGCLSKFVISEAALNLPSSSFIFYNVLHMCSQGHWMQELPVRQRHLCTSTQTRSPLNQDLDWSLKPLISFHCFLHFFNHWMCCHVVVLSCFDPQPANIHTQKHNETMFSLVNSSTHFWSMKSLSLQHLQPFFETNTRIYVVSLQSNGFERSLAVLPSEIPRTHRTTLLESSDQGLTSTHIRHGGQCRKYDWNIVKHYAQIKWCWQCTIIIRTTSRFAVRLSRSWPSAWGKLIRMWPSHGGPCSYR